MMNRNLKTAQVAVFLLIFSIHPQNKLIIS